MVQGHNTLPGEENIQNVLETQNNWNGATLMEFESLSLEHIFLEVTRVMSVQNKQFFHDSLHGGVGVRVATVVGEMLKMFSHLSDCRARSGCQCPQRLT